MDLTFEQIARRLDASGLRWCVCAGAAAAAYGTGRPITDIDILLPADAGEQAAALFPEAHVKRRADGSVEELQLPGCDIMPGWSLIDLDGAMAARVGRRDVAGVSVPVIPAEDNILFKAMLGRGADVGKHDWEDVQGMLAHGPALDWEYLRWRAAKLGPEERMAPILARLETMRREESLTATPPTDKPARRLKVNVDEVAAAMESYSEIEEMFYYLDLETGAVILVTESSRDELEAFYEQANAAGLELTGENLAALIWDSELPDWQKSSVLEAHLVESGWGKRYLSIPQNDSHEGYRDMEHFISTVRNQPLRDRLWRAISGRGAFRYFKDVLAENPRERERWFAFRDELQLERVRDWLASEGIELIE